MNVFSFVWKVLTIDEKAVSDIVFIKCFPRNFQMSKIVTFYDTVLEHVWPSVDQWDFLEIWLGADAAILKWNIAVAEFLKIILVCHSSMPKFWILGLGRKIFPRILSFVFEHFSKNITTYAFLNSFVSVLSLLSSVLCCFLNKSENHFQNYYLAKKALKSNFSKKPTKNIFTAVAGK